MPQSILNVFQAIKPFLKSLPFQAALRNYWLFFTCLLCVLIIPVSGSMAAETSLYETGTLSFSTSNQSMWETGAGIAPKSDTLTTSWDTSDSFGEITGSARVHVPGTGGSIPNPARPIYDTAWAICRELASADICRNGSSALDIPGLGSRPSATISNPISAQYIDTRAGFKGTISTSGHVGVTSDFGVNGGTIDAAYEFSASMEYPAQVRAGEFFSLNPVSSMNSSQMISKFPTLTGRISASMETYVDLNTNTCVYLLGCTSTSDSLVSIDIDPEFLKMNTADLPPDTASLFSLDDLAFDATKLQVYADFSPLPPLVTLSLPLFPRPLLAFNLGDLLLDAPSSDLGMEATFENGKLVSSSKFEKVIELNVDLDIQATVLGAFPIAGAVFNAGPLTFRGDLLDIGIGPTVDINQDIGLTSTFMVRLDFDFPVLVRDFEQLGIRSVTSITAPFGELPDIALIDGQIVTVTPTFYLDADLDNLTEMNFGLSFFQDVLKGELKLLVASLWNDCLICETEPVADFGGVELFDDTFALGGFQPITKENFTLITNHPPEFSHVPADRNIEGNISGGASNSHTDIAAFLAEVAVTDVEDDDSTLIIEYSPELPLPAELPLGGSTTMTFSVTDSFGDTTTAQATITIVDTTPPTLSIDNLTVVSEGPIGTYVPDEDGEISAWLLSYIEGDIVDDNPIVTSTPPALLDLGINVIAFSAIDGSGNSITIEAEVYVKSPFSLFANNSINIDRNTNVESGMVAIPAVTAGPWLDKHAQLVIGRHSVIAAGSEVFSPSLDLERDAQIDTAYFSELSGKGTVNQGNPYFPGIYFTLDALPLFTVGSEDVIVACKSKKSVCQDSGIVLEPGNYGVLDIGKGKKHQPTVVYLAGGTYSFSEIEMGGNTSLVALAPTLILVENRIKAREHSLITQQASGSEEERELIIMVAGLDKFKNSGKSDKGDKSNKKDNDKLKIKEFAVSIGHDSLLEATVFAANGSIELQRNSTLTGTLIGENLEIGREVLINFDEGI